MLRHSGVDPLGGLVNRGGEVADEGRSAADRGEYRQAVGVLGATAARDTFRTSNFNFRIEQCALRIRVANRPCDRSHSTNGAFLTSSGKEDVPELARSFSDENGADGTRVGNRVLDRAHFRQSGICIRYAARLRLHDLEAWASHLRRSRR